MAPSVLSQWMMFFAAEVPSWRGLRIPTKVAAAASILVLASMVYVGILVTGHVREGVIQRSAAAAAHYMDSFVEGHAQDLATKSALSADTTAALERLLSPAAAHRPIIAFRIWKGDTVVFSNDRQLVGRAFPRTAARERALQGDVTPEFDHRDGDDDEQVRSLNLPILEVYAPVHERGTGRIIAVVETYEIAVGLQSEIFAGQLRIWIAIAAVTLTVMLLLASMANAGNSLLGRIAELTHLRAESEQRRRRISDASIQVSEMNERALQRLGNNLHEGPAQLVALAMLKFGSLEQLVTKAMPSYEDGEMEDLWAIRQALNDALRHIRCVAGHLPLPEIEPLSVVETLAAAARRHEHLTGGVAVKLETHALPEQLSFPIKACLYRFALESLDTVCASSGARSLSVRASSDGGRIVVRTFCIEGAPGEQARPLVTNSAQIKGLRDRMEAIGGSVVFRSTRTGAELVAELSLPTGACDG
jgi:signal transduction histidine kinase